MHKPSRRILGAVAIVIGAVYGVAPAQPAAAPDDRKSEPAPRPNIVFVLADDLGIGDLGCYNPDSKIPTPNADRLAGGGIRFTDAHSPSAVCSPTRYAILTGRYAWRSRLKSWVLNGYSRALIEPGRPTTASMLGREGYRSAVVGKWHLGLGAFDATQPDLETDYSRPLDAGPLTAGFDEAFLITASLDMPPYVFVAGDRPIEPMSGTTPASKRRWDGGGGFWRAGAVGDTFDFDQCLPRLTEEAVRVVHEGAGRDEPFFLYFPLTAPHTPWMPTEEWRGASAAGWYGDFVAQVDHSLGRVLDAIDEAGIAGETVVIFTSDNGSHWRPADEEQFGHLANLRFRGMKADIYEAGHRVPLIVRAPGVTPEGAVSHVLVGLHDLYATIAEMVGIEAEEGEAPDSISFLGALSGSPRAASRESIVHHSGDGMFAVRRGPWKLIDGLGSGGFTAPRRQQPDEGEPEGQLYNLADDPTESINLFAEQPGIVKALRATLDEIRSADH